MNKDVNKYVFLTIVAVCFLASGAILVRSSSLPPIAAGFYRILFSMPILYPLIKHKLVGISKKDSGVMILAGVFLALDLLFWHISFYYTTIANANLLGNLVPFTIVPLSYILFKKRFSKYFFIGAGITLLGLVILLSSKFNPSIKNYQGDLLAFITSIFYALFLLSVSKLREKLDAMVIIFISGFGTLITLFFAMLVFEGFCYPDNLKDLLILISLAVVSQICGQGLLSYTVGKIEVSLSSIILLCQPVLAAIYSFLLFDERLSMFEIVGMFIVLVGIYFAKKSFN